MRVYLIFFFSFIFFPLDVLALKKLSLFSAGDHCVAYSTNKKLALIKKVRVIGRNCKISAQVLPDIGGVYEFEVIIPVAEFSSGESERDRDVIKLLEAHNQPNLVFKTKKMNRSEWLNLLAPKSLSLSGHLNIGGKSYPVVAQAVINDLNPKKLEIDGVIKTKFKNFNIKPPQLVAGLAARVDEDLELHFHLVGEKILGLSSILEE